MLDWRVIGDDGLRTQQLVIILRVRIRLFYQRLAEIYVPHHHQLLQLAGPGAVQHGPDVDVQVACLGVRHLADVALIRLHFVVRLQLLLGIETAQNREKSTSWTSLMMSSWGQ